MPPYGHGDSPVKENTVFKRFLLVALALPMIACNREPVEAKDRHTVHRENEPSSNGSVNSLPIQVGPATSMSSGLDNAQSQATPVTKTPFPDIPRSRDNLDLESDPFGATSEAEKKWLDAHGFPNARQWETYTIASDYLLEQAANSGDRVARTMLDARRLPDDPEAKTRLFSAGAEGDIFALNSLAAYMAGSKDGNLPVGYSISRVAEMRGDARVAMARDVMMPRRLTDLEKMQAEADAIRMNNQLDRIYQDKYGSPPPPPIRRPVTELEN